jgi:type I restriction enzyme R subunit
MEYSRQRAVADGVNVDGQVYRIRTRITEGGSTVEAGYYVGKRDRKTRRERWEQLDEDFEYSASQLDESVTAESQIRTVIRAYRDRLFTDLFPGRTETPKTLIFAKDDNHAEEIVRIAREEFGKGNDFCQKITYRVSGVKPEDLIASFRNTYHPRIAVSVDMIATGTDIKPLEVLLFMRPVRSRLLYEQMLGRGTRVISPTDLQAVTPDAGIKERFVIIDAVGVAESDKVDTQTLDRKPSLKLDKLLEIVALGVRDEDTLSTLAARLAALQKKTTPHDDYALAALAGEGGLRELANRLLDAIDPDRIHDLATQLAATDRAGARPAPTNDNVGASLADAHSLAGTLEPDEAHRLQAAEQLARQAAAPFDDPALRNKLIEIQGRNEITLDKVSIDEVTYASFGEAEAHKARQTVESFRQYIEQHKDEITALQIIFNQPYGKRRLTFQQVKELAEQLRQPNGWTTESLWNAYAQLELDKVRGAGGKRVLTDLVSLVRHAVQMDDELTPFPDRVARRYAVWMADQEAAGTQFTPEQRAWLDLIARHVGVNLAISAEDFEYGEFFNRGGLFKARQLFGAKLEPMLDELNTVLTG